MHTQITNLLIVPQQFKLPLSIYVRWFNGWNETIWWPNSSQNSSQIREKGLELISTRKSVYLFCLVRWGCLVVGAVHVSWEVTTSPPSTAEAKDGAADKMEK